MKTINLTQHPASYEQIMAGVIDLPEVERIELQKLLTFDNIPDATEINERATAIAELVENKADEIVCAMIGGAPYLMAPLEKALRSVGFYPVYAFSVRESMEQTAPDGSVKKVNIFRHTGFVFAV
jgi:ribonucleotide reductase beta subunit family protein with ferritin-like domain